MSANPVKLFFLQAIGVFIKSGEVSKSKNYKRLVFGTISTQGTHTTQLKEVGFTKDFCKMKLLFV
jgi:hypothetical protein